MGRPDRIRDPFAGKAAAGGAWPKGGVVLWGVAWLAADPGLGGGAYSCSARDRSLSGPLEGLGGGGTLKGDSPIRRVQSLGRGLQEAGFSGWTYPSRRERGRGFQGAGSSGAQPDCRRGTSRWGLSGWQSSGGVASGRQDLPVGPILGARGRDLRGRGPASRLGPWRRHLLPSVCPCRVPTACPWPPSGLCSNGAGSNARATAT